MPFIVDLPIKNGVSMSISIPFTSIPLNHSTQPHSIPCSSNIETINQSFIRSTNAASSAGWLRTCWRAFATKRRPRPPMVACRRSSSEPPWHSSVTSHPPCRAMNPRMCWCGAAAKSLGDKSEPSGVRQRAGRRQVEDSCRDKWGTTKRQVGDKWDASENQVGEKG